MTTISKSTLPLAAELHAIAGGKIRIKLKNKRAPAGRRYGQVLDENNNVIGDASDAVFGGRRFSIHTRPFGGFVPVEQIEFV